MQGAQLEVPAGQGGAAGAGVLEAVDQQPSWNRLPDHLQAKVLCSLETPALRLARAVCKGWRKVVDTHLETVQPKLARMEDIVRMFPNAKSLHLGKALPVSYGPAADLSAVSRLVHLKSLDISASETLVFNHSRLTWEPEAIAALSALTDLCSLKLSGQANAAVGDPQEQALPLVLRAHAPQLTELDLGGSVPLSPAVWAGIGGCSALQSLRLRDKGGDSAELAPLGEIAPSLTALAELDISATGWVDAAKGGFKGLSALTALKSLTAQRCCKDVTEAAWADLQYCTGLTALDVSGSPNFEEPALVEYTTLESLKCLIVKATPITGASLSSLPNLTALDLSCCSHLKSRHVLRWLANAADHLETLTMQHTSIQVDMMPDKMEDAYGPLPADWLSNLRELDISDSPTCVIVAHALRIKPDAVKLRKVDFSRCVYAGTDTMAVFDDVLHDFGHKGLEELHARQCGRELMNGEIMSDMHCLRVLDAGFSGVDAKELIPALGHLESLSALRMARANFVDEGLRELPRASLSGLQELDLRYNTSLTDEGMDRIGTLTALQSLDLSLCSNVEDEALGAALSKLTHLRKLRLASTKAGLAVATVLPRLPSLHHVSLSTCAPVDEACVPHIARCQAVQFLDLELPASQHTLTMRACLRSLGRMPALRYLMVGALPAKWLREDRALPAWVSLR